MFNSKILLKYIILLGVWSFILIMIVRYVFKSASKTSTTATTSIISIPKDRVLPNEVLIDKRTVDEDSFVRDTASQNPSLPIEYWSKTKDTVNEMSPICAKYPSIFDLEFSNIYWQMARTSNGTFQLFGAYYDNRKSSTIGPSVRILGMLDRIEPTIKTSCQFWFDNQSKPIFVETLEYTYAWYKYWGNYDQGIYGPYLITCQIPKDFHGIVPATVSIVENICDTATNNLRVIYNPPPDKQKKGFAVCVKGLDYLYDDMSVRLVEWIELLRILGAEKIYFYQLHVHPNMSKILNYYEQEGIVHVTPLTLGGGQPNAPGLQHLFVYNRITHARQSEIIPYDDCLYKNMYMYDFLALLDIDEVIIPKNDRTWAELMQRVLLKSRLPDKTYDSYDVRNVYFLHENHITYDDIPKYLLMLQHVNRAKNYSEPGDNVKCFHDTERVLSLHNHFPMLCLDGWCDSYSIDTEDAQLHHYCELDKNCDEFRETSVKDTTILKYKDELVRRSVQALDRAGFFAIP